MTARIASWLGIKTQAPRAIRGATPGAPIDPEQRAGAIMDSLIEDGPADLAIRVPPAMSPRQDSQSAGAIMDGLIGPKQ